MNNPKDLKKTYLMLPNKIPNIKDNVSKVLDINEKTIENFIERFVYTNALTENTKELLYNIFKTTRDDILKSI